MLLSVWIMPMIVSWMQSYLYNQKRRKTYGKSKIKFASLSGIILSILSGAVFDTRKLSTTLHKPDASFYASFLLILQLFQPPHDKTNKMTDYPAKTQPWLAWVSAQSDQSLRCALNG